MPGHWLLSSPIIVLAPVSGPSFSEEDTVSRPCRSLSRGMEAGRCWRPILGPTVFSIAGCLRSPLLLSSLSSEVSDSTILVFLRPLAGALAVLRSRWLLKERLRGRIPNCVSTEDLEPLLNRPRKPRN